MRDEHDRAAADVERVAQLGLERLHRVERQLVERDQQPEHDEHEHAALGERLAEVDRLGVDAGQQVVGEDHLFLGAGLRRLARRLLVEHGGRERRGAALALAGSWRSVTCVSRVGLRRRRCGDRTRALTSRVRRAELGTRLSS